MNKQNKGFTLVELLFATAIFSTILLLCLSALIQIGRMYYKGVTTAQTQQTARALLDELTQSMQLTNVQISPVLSTAGVNVPELAGPRIAPSGNAVGFFCIGATRYTFAMDRMKAEVNDPAEKKIRHAIWVDEPGFCAGASAATLFATAPVDLTAEQPSDPLYRGRDMLSNNMRLLRLRILPQASDGSVWSVQLTVGYGEEDLLVDDPENSSRRFCRGRTVGSEFCAFSELSTIVKRRIQ